MAWGWWPGMGYAEAKPHCFSPALIYKYPLALHSQLDFTFGLGAGSFVAKLTERGKLIVFAAGGMSDALKRLENSQLA